MQVVDKIIGLISNKPSLTKLFFTLSYIVFGLLVTLVVFLSSIYHEKNYTQSYIHKEVLHLQSVKTDLLYEMIARYKQHVLAYAQNPIVIEYLQDTNSANRSRLESLFWQNIFADEKVMQLRLIGKDGKEDIRLERQNSSSIPKIIEQNGLQDKSKRPYFQNASVVSQGEVWISSINLNVENGKIQEPFEPTIRIATPLFIDGDFRGIIVVTLFLKETLQRFQKSPDFDIVLLDENANVIVGTFFDGSKRADYSWSKDLNKRVVFPEYIESKLPLIINSSSYLDGRIFSSEITKNIGLQERLFLVLIPQQSLLSARHSDVAQILVSILLLVVVASIVLGILISIIPAKLADQVVKSKKSLDSSKLVFDEYVRAIEMNNIVTKSDLRGKITYINENFTKITGYTQEEVMGKPHSILRHPENPKSLFKDMWETIQNNQIWQGIVKNKKKNGDYYYVDAVIVPIHDVSGKVIEYLGVRHEITELMDQKEYLYTLSMTDPLTLSGNRVKLDDDIKKHYSNNLAVIDIDSFGLINDFYGYKVGDELLVKFAQTLSSYLDSSFSLYRLEADRFAILNTSLENDAFVVAISTLNTKMTRASIQTSLKEFDIVTTTGISFESNESLLATAEITNKYAKEVKKHVLVYSNDLGIEKRFEENITWTNKIRQALIDNRFVLFFQPILNNHTGKIEKYEGLIRMIDLDDAVISPYFFLDVAKSTKQYFAITQKVIQLACEKFADVDAEFSINLTIEDIVNDELFAYMVDMFDSYGVTNKVVVEIVESENISSYEKVFSVIDNLKHIGCKIAVDDFGTGYSNFDYLIKIRANYIKIDGSIIKNIDNPQTKELVKVIIAFAKSMGYKTIAEFVSSQEIFDEVKRLGVDYSQGFFIAPPDETLAKEPLFK